MTSNISKFSDYYNESSYWLDDLSPSEEKSAQQPELPGQTDLVIVGSGYTGLNAAIETATISFDKKPLRDMENPVSKPRKSMVRIGAITGIVIKLEFILVQQKLSTRILF